VIDTSARAQNNSDGDRRFPQRDFRNDKRNIEMDIRPLHDRVLVRRLEEGESRVGSILIPDSAKEKPQQGEVIAVGSGKLLDSGQRAALDVKSGDRILFGKYSGSDIKIEGQEYMIMREDEILGVLD
jgi:chaperonin GroES